MQFKQRIIKELESELYNGIISTNDYLIVDIDFSNRIGLPTRHKIPSFFHVKSCI